ncbi:Clp protease N-terminal domain-containing protein [Allokutzneria albata]|uniref:Clp amino terminal domain-containing protein, pathogenicity island component n=1 Tax=Allokutzneria albata TaxID=211114 RepID=A0A1G9TRZ7_ALLAB|nr:Clp protease N-terminal domain-containing protein [Allokutzneria albata]SDM49935.1 Clp amino terminal domain-containing protein, pathogenicity island component [Allokutzneria albata]
MPKINVYLPDELAEAVKATGVPVSAICQRALEQSVRRVTAIRETALGDLGVDDPTARLAHYTERARVAVRLGIERARRAGSDTVGSEHLLGGMLAEGGNLALHVLRAVDIDAEQLLRELDSAAATEEGTGERFGSDAANVLELAVTEAIALGHNYVGCEHLLLGLVSEPDGKGGELLRARGAELRLTRRAVSAALAGYVHLRAQTGPQADAAALLQPIMQRLDRIEKHVGL